MGDNQLSADLEALIGDMFAGESKEASRLLLGYSDREANRVRRAILTLSKGRIDLVRYYVGFATHSYRDILCWAEYPYE